LLAIPPGMLAAVDVIDSSKDEYLGRRGFCTWVGAFVVVLASMRFLPAAQGDKAGEFQLGGKGGIC